MIHLKYRVYEYDDNCICDDGDYDDDVVMMMVIMMMMMMMMMMIC